MNRKLGENEIEKHIFYQQKNQILIYNVDINNILVSNKASFGKKGFRFFICFKDGKKVRPLGILLPKIGAYRRDFDETKFV